MRLKREYSGIAPGLSSVISGSGESRPPHSFFCQRWQGGRGRVSGGRAWLGGCVWLCMQVGCGNEAESKLMVLGEENLRLRGEIQSLEQTLSQRELNLTKLKHQLHERNTELISTRLGLTSQEDTIDALVSTSLGNLRIRLDWQHTPYIVQNFVALAEGTRAFRDPSTGVQVRRPFYDGLTFHRVMPDLLIQGGDPLGTGTGGPGFALPDEIHPALRHDRPGRVGMANTGPDTNGAQFYIMLGAAPSFDGRYTLFGEVTEGMEIVQAIAKVPTDKDARPLAPVVIQQVRIARGAPGQETGSGRD